MKRKFIFAIFLLQSFWSYSQVVDSLVIESKILNEKRTIRIYLPDAYQYQPEQKFDVAYVFDAQARMYFDNVHATYGFLNTANPLIVIGIASTFDESRKQNRNTDFLPKPLHDGTAEGYDGYVGNADNFARFVREEVIAYVDKTYRTMPYRIAIGHSNGGTFLFYNLLTNPDVFDAYFLISPNLDYDQEQLVEKLKASDPEKLAGKFIYMCNSDEGEKWKGWKEARNKVIAMLEADSKYIRFYNDDFSKTESHMSVFPIGLFSAFKHFIDYKYLSAGNIIPYYTKLEKEKIIVLTPDFINGMAYNCSREGKTADAVSLLNWAIGKFPDDTNLYDSMGEIEENAGNKTEALKYYKMCFDKIESLKPKLEKAKYEALKRNALNRIVQASAN